MQTADKPDRSGEIEALLTEHDESGVSFAQLARDRGIPVRQIYYWNRKRRVGSSKAKPAQRLAPVSIVPDEFARPARIEVELRSGHRVLVPSGFDEAELSRLTRTLDRC